jgi:histone deacetylase complex subunit SAP18
MAGVGSAVERRIKTEPEKLVVNRESTCPLLLRVFCSTSRHNPMADYNRGNVPNNELQIYTWMDATLKELTGLVKEVNPEARRRGTYFDFALVFPDLGMRTSQYRSRDIGTTVAGQKGPDDHKTLADCKFVIGDYLDIAVTPPTGRMDRMDRMDFGPPRRFGGGGRGGMGERRDRPY